MLCVKTLELFNPGRLLDPAFAALADEIISIDWISCAPASILPVPIRLPLPHVTATTHIPTPGIVTVFDHLLIRKTAIAVGNNGLWTKQSRQDNRTGEQCECKASRSRSCCAYYSAESTCEGRKRCSDEHSYRECCFDEHRQRNHCSNEHHHPTRTLQKGSDPLESG